MSQMGEGISHLSQLAVLRKLAGTSTPQLLQYTHLADFNWASVGELGDASEYVFARHIIYQVVITHP
jgi:hypothetical protein